MIHPKKISGRRPRPVAAGALFLAWLGVAVGQIGAMSASVGVYDEGLILFGAARVARGDMPYHDFWSMYGPGSFYLLGALDKVFGESILLGRVVDALSRAGAIVAIYALLQRRVGQVPALGAATVAFAILIADRSYLYPALPATAFVLLALCLLDGALQRPPASSPWAWAWPGAAAGAAFLFRPDFGLTAMAACFWALLAPFVRQRAGDRRVGVAAGALLAGGCVVAGPLYAWLVGRGAAAELVDNLVRLPMQVYVANRGLPFPRPLATLRAALAQHQPALLFTLVVYLPPLAALGGVWVAVRRRRAGPPAAAAAERLFEASLVAMILLCLKGSVRVQFLHMIPALLVAIAAAGQLWPPGRLANLRARRAALAGLCLLAVLGLVAAHRRTQQMARFGGPPSALLFADWSACTDPSRARLGCFHLDRDLAAVLRYLGAHAAAGDRLFVGAGRHDKLFVNNVELYFLSGLPAATKWADLHPGVQTSAEVQRQMFAEMQAHPPAFVVRNTAFDQIQEPNASRIGSGVQLLDDFLRLHYRIAFSAGTLSVAVPRRDAAR